MNMNSFDRPLQFVEETNLLIAHYIMSQLMSMLHFFCVFLYSLIFMLSKQHIIQLRLINSGNLRITQNQEIFQHVSYAVNKWHNTKKGILYGAISHI